MKLKRHFFIFIFLFALSINSIASGPALQNSKKKTFYKSIKGENNKTLYMKDSKADIYVIKGKSDSICVNASIEIAHDNVRFIEKYLEECQLILKPYSNGYRVELKTPQYKNRSGQDIVTSILKDLFNGKVGNFSSYVEIKITVPQKTNINIDNRYGNVFVTEISGELEISNTSGSVEIDDCEGSVDIKNKYDSVEIGNFAGNVKVETSNGDVRLEGIHGDTQIVCSYRDVS